MCKDTKKNAHLQISPKKNCTIVHFFSSRVAYGLARICGYATKKGNRVAIFFFGEKHLPKCPAFLHCIFEVGLPQAMSVPSKIRKKIDISK